MLVPLVRREVTSMKKQLTIRKKCKHGVCWKKADINSTKTEEIRAGLTAECGKPSKRESQEND